MTAAAPTPPAHDAAGSHWTIEIDGDRVAWLTFDKPGASANALSRPAAVLKKMRHPPVELSPIASTS